MHTVCDGVYDRGMTNETTSPLLAALETHITGRGRTTDGAAVETMFNSMPPEDAEAFKAALFTKAISPEAAVDLLKKHGAKNVCSAVTLRRWVKPRLEGAK